VIQALPFAEVMIKGLPFVLFMIFEMLMVGLAFKLSKTETVQNHELNASKLKYKFNVASGTILFLAYVVFVIFFTFVVIATGSEGNDAIIYKTRFEQANIPLFQSLKLQNNEWGYGFLIWLIRAVFSDYKVVLFTIFSFTFCAMIYFIRQIKWTTYTVLSYSMILVLVVTGMCLIRNIFSVSLGMITYGLLYEKKYKKAFIVATIAVSIHISSLILYPIIIICIILDNEKFSIKKLSFYIILSAIFLFILMGVASSLINGSKYSAYNATEGVAIATYMMFFIVLFLSFLRYENLVARNQFNRTLLIILATGSLCLVMQLRYSIAYRMLLFYIPITFALVSELMEEYKIFSFHKNGGMFVVYLGLFSYVALIVYKFFSVGAVSYGLYPYIFRLY
jgi:hypothetical protein